jgi:hypothetical protein
VNDVKKKSQHGPQCAHNNNGGLQRIRFRFHVPTLVGTK